MVGILMTQSFGGAPGTPAVPSAIIPSIVPSIRNVRLAIAMACASPSRPGARLGEGRWTTTSGTSSSSATARFPLIHSSSN